MVERRERAVRALSPEELEHLTRYAESLATRDSDYPPRPTPNHRRRSFAVHP